MGSAHVCWESGASRNRRFGGGEEIGVKLECDGRRVLLGVGRAGWAGGAKQGTAKGGHGQVLMIRIASEEGYQAGFRGGVAYKGYTFQEYADRSGCLAGGVRCAS